MIALLLAACTTPTETVAPPTAVPVPVPAPNPQPDPPQVGTTPLGEIEVPERAAPSRPRRRMDIAQLDASIQVATGGIAWEVGGVNQFEALSSSLGVPDYVDRTSEDLSAGLLFQKFLDDAANEVCHTLVEREFAGTSSVFLTQVDPLATSATDPAGVDATLADAVLRFHGYRIPAGDPQLDSWRFLFDSTVSVTGGDTQAGWRAVCIGLILHPDFYQY